MIDSEMQAYKLLFLLHACGCSFFYTANAHENMCLKCENVLKNCNPREHLLFKYPADASKVKYEVGSTDPILEDCLKPDMKVTDTLDMVVCSVTKNNSCGVIAKKTLDSSSVRNACLSCWRHCDCDCVKVSDAVREKGLSTNGLGLFSIVVYLNSFYF